MTNYKLAIAETLAPLIGINPEEIQAQISYPQNPLHGDFAFPCFALAKLQRKAPPLIAKELAEKLTLQSPLEKVEAINGYLNFFVSAKYFAEETLSEISSQGKAYGDNTLGKDQTCLIDFSSPNMGKELVFHHLRGTMLGNALSKIFHKSGYHVVRINHLGDWGTSYGKLIVMFLEQGDYNDSDLEKLTLEKLNALYKQFSHAAELNPELENSARQAFQKLESGDQEYFKLWKTFREVTLKELKRLYAILDVEFDHYVGEAFFIDKISPVIETLQSKNLLVNSQGAVIVDLSAFELPPLLIQKSDGATLYATRDIAAAIYRQAEFKFDKCLYIVDNGQSLHFQQFFKVLELMEYSWWNKCEHIPFGLVLNKSDEGKWEKGKTRSGHSSLLKDVIEKGEDRVLEIMSEKNPALGQKRELAQKIVIGALVFDDLKNRRLNDIRFEWERVLSFEGDSGPYVQNAHVRLCSILRKGPALSKPHELDFSCLHDPQAKSLIHALYLFPEKIKAALLICDPCLIGQYILEIAENVHGFVHSCRVLGSPEEKERLFLIYCAKSVLANALELLGVPAIEEM